MEQDHIDGLGAILRGMARAQENGDKAEPIFPTTALPAAPAPTGATPEQCQLCDDAAVLDSNGICGPCNDGTGLELAAPTECQHVPYKTTGGPNDDEVIRCRKCGDYLKQEAPAPTEQAELLPREVIDSLESLGYTMPLPTDIPQPIAGAIALLEAFSQLGMTAKKDGKPTPNSLLCSRLAAELRAYAGHAPEQVHQVKHHGDGKEWTDVEPARFGKFADAGFDTRTLYTTPPAPVPSTLAEQSETRTTLWKMPEEDGTLRQWYFDCDGHYIDVALDDGKYSIFFRDRATNQDAWLDLADEVVAAVPRKAAVASPALSEKHECVIRLAAKAVVNRGHDGDAKLADSLIGVLAHLKSAAPSSATSPGSAYVPIGLRGAKQKVNIYDAGQTRDRSKLKRADREA
jgi:hypothetical protein